MSRCADRSLERRSATVAATCACAKVGREPAGATQMQQHIGNQALQRLMGGDRSALGHYGQQTERATCPSLRSLPRIDPSGLLIQSAVVRAAMWEAYRRSRMGGARTDRLEHGAKVLRAPMGALHTVVYPGYSATQSSADPGSLNIRIDRSHRPPRGLVGSSVIVGSMHTHPNYGPDACEPPSSSDRATVRIRPELHGREHYVIGLDHIYVILPDGRTRLVGRTGAWLFQGIERVRPP
jgi:hypothetical protein